MKISRALGIGLGFALFAAISACKDDPANLRSNQNPPVPPPGLGMGFTTGPQESNSNTDSQIEGSATTDTAPNDSEIGED